MNRQRQLVTFYKPYFFAFWQNVIAAIDGHRDNGHLHLLGKREGSLAERLHLASAAARAFGEHRQTHARQKYLLCLTVGAAHGTGVAVIDKDVSCVLAAPSEERHLLKGTLHHPTEFHTEVAADEKDVKGPLMIGGKDIGLALDYMLPTLHLDPYECCGKDDACPPL